MMLGVIIQYDLHMYRNHVNKIQKTGRVTEVSVKEWGGGRWVGVVRIPDLVF